MTLHLFDLPETALFLAWGGFVCLLGELACCYCGVAADNDFHGLGEEEGGWEDWGR